MAISEWMKKLTSKRLHPQYIKNKSVADQFIESRMNELKADPQSMEDPLQQAVTATVYSLGKKPTFKQFKKLVQKQYRDYLRQASTALGRHDSSEQQTGQNKPSLSEFLDQYQNEIEAKLDNAYRTVLADRLKIRVEQIISQAHDQVPPEDRETLADIHNQLRKIVNQMDAKELTNALAGKNYNTLQHLWRRLPEQKTSNTKQVANSHNLLNNIAYRNRGFSNAKLRNMQRQGSKLSGMINFRVFNYLAAPNRHDYNVHPHFSNVLDQSTDRILKRRRHNRQHYQQEQAQEQKQSQAPTPRPGNKRQR